MAAHTPTLTIDNSAPLDAARELAKAIEALAHRHGDRFRALERQIEALELQPEDLVTHDLGDGNIAFSCPKIGALLRESRRLGLI